MRFEVRIRLLFACTLPATFCLLQTGWTQPMKEIGYDDDSDLDFVWTPPYGIFDHYNVYVSEDGGAYELNGKALSERYTVKLDAYAKVGHWYRIKVAAVTSEDREGPSSPESDPVVYDPLAPSGDNDSDGIPNYLEYYYRDILDPETPGDADMDADGDGRTNYQEFLAGTDPAHADAPRLDKTPPVLVLSGDNPLTLEVGYPYAEPGFTATDDRDGDITTNVTVTGLVDYTVPGSYALHYSVSDSSGNPAEEEVRTVNVVETGRSAIMAIDAPGGMITLTWTCLPQATYTIWSCPDLATGEWVQEGTVTSPSGPAIWTDPDTNSTRKFYRIGIE